MSLKLGDLVSNTSSFMSDIVEMKDDCWIMMPVGWIKLEKDDVYIVIDLIPGRVHASGSNAYVILTPVGLSWIYEHEVVHVASI